MMERKSRSIEFAGVSPVSVWKDQTDSDLIDSENPLILMSAEEIECLKRAGRAGGAVLLGFGETNMAKLSAEQWQNFTATLILEYENQMVGMLLGEVA